MTKFDKVIVNEYGGADKLSFAKDAGDLEELKATAGELEVVVKNAYAGVNFIDTYFRSGLYPQKTPFTVGQEGSGEIVAVGKGMDPKMVGKKVAYWGNKSGSYAGYTVVGVMQMAMLPEDADLRKMAAVMLQGLTSHYLSHDTYAVKKGDVVLIHAAAGGCGLLLGQMCKSKGATVIGTCGAHAKVALAKAIGKYDHVINYVDQPDFVAEVRKICPQGVNVVYDGVGAATFEGSLRCLRPRGHLVSFGNASGPVPPIPPLHLTRFGSLYLTRPTLTDYVADPKEREARCRDICTWVKDGSLKVTVGKEFNLTEARQAHE
eukprot:gene15663-23910_t